MPINTALFLLGCLALVAGWWGTLRYRTPLNPLTYFVFWEVGCRELLSAGGMIFSGTNGFADSDVVRTLAISMVDLVGVTLPFLCRGTLPASVFGRGMRFLGLDSLLLRAARFSRSKFTVLLLSTAACFLALAVLGGGGTLWLIDPRAAYVNYRHPAGAFWILGEGVFTFALIYHLWSSRPSGLKLILTLVAFAAGGWFTGSRGCLVSIVVVGAAYYQFRIGRIPVLVWALLAGLLLGLVHVLLVLQGFDVEDSVRYFDHFSNTTMFVSRYNEFGTYHRSVLLSAFWVYVPRILFPSKPYSYGPTLLNEVLFPGAGERGYYPGYVDWAQYYFDFGTLGVFCAGVVNALWFRASYEYYLDHRENLFAFEYMLFISLTNLNFGTPPFLYFVLWTLVQSIFLRTVWRPERLQAGEPAGLLPSPAL